MAKRHNKRPARKRTDDQVAEYDRWVVLRGKLVPGNGRPDKVDSLFKVVAEKVPFECLSKVQKDMTEQDLPTEGIYLAHDSMRAVRYAGRGAIFSRLRARRKSYPVELRFFSLYVVLNKKHEREIETLIIRATSHQLDFNERKKRSTVEPGSVLDYEPDTYFYERQYKKGRKPRS